MSPLFLFYGHGLQSLLPQTGVVPDLIFVVIDLGCIVSLETLDADGWVHLQNKHVK